MKHKKISAYFVFFIFFLIILATVFCAFVIVPFFTSAIDAFFLVDSTEQSPFALYFTAFDSFKTFFSNQTHRLAFVSLLKLLAISLAVLVPITYPIMHFLHKKNIFSSIMQAILIFPLAIPLPVVQAFFYHVFFNSKYGLFAKMLKLLPFASSLQITGQNALSANYLFTSFCVSIILYGVSFFVFVYTIIQLIKNDDTHTNLNTKKFVSFKTLILCALCWSIFVFTFLHWDEIFSPASNKNALYLPVRFLLDNTLQGQELSALRFVLVFACTILLVLICIVYNLYNLHGKKSLANKNACNLANAHKTNLQSILYYAFFALGLIFALIFAIFIVYCTINLLLMSFSLTKEIFASKLLATGLHAENFVDCMQKYELLSPLRITLLTSAVASTISILFALFGAFCTAKCQNAKKSQKLSVFFAFCLMVFPCILSIEPLWQFLQQLNLPFLQKTQIDLHDTSANFLQWVIFCAFCTLYTVAPAYLLLRARFASLQQTQNFMTKQNVILSKKARACQVFTSIMVVWAFVFIQIYNNSAIASVIGLQGTMSTTLLTIIANARFSSDWHLFYASLVLYAIVPSILYFVFCPIFFKTQKHHPL